MRPIQITLYVMISLSASAQVNCNVYKYKGDESCYKACELANEAAEYQGTGYSQKKFDEAVKDRKSVV